MPRITKLSKVICDRMEVDNEEMVDNLGHRNQVRSFWNSDF